MKKLKLGLIIGGSVLGAAALGVGGWGVSEIVNTINNRDEMCGDVNISRGKREAIYDPPTQLKEQFSQYAFDNLLTGFLHHSYWAIPRYLFNMKETNIMFKPYTLHLTKDGWFCSIYIQNNEQEYPEDLRVAFYVNAIQLIKNDNGTYYMFHGQLYNKLMFPVPGEKYFVKNPITNKYVYAYNDKPYWYIEREMKSMKNAYVPLGNCKV